MTAGARPAAENPFGFGQLLMAVYLYVKKPVEVTVVTKSSNDMSRWLNSVFLPDAITAVVGEQDLKDLQNYAFFKGRTAEGGETAFVCRNFTCSLPLTTQKDLARQIGQPATPS
jgi:uncharacterized protein YyaL (SSP411 family)